MLECADCGSAVECVDCYERCDGSVCEFTEKYECGHCGSTGWLEWNHHGKEIVKGRIQVVL